MSEDDLAKDLAATLEHTEFCCPRCRGNRFSTSGLSTDDRKYWRGHCEESHCSFTWPRTEDAKCFRPPRHVLVAKLKELFEIARSLKNADDMGAVHALRRHAEQALKPAQKEHTVAGTQL